MELSWALGRWPGRLFHFRNIVLWSFESVYVGVSLRNALSAWHIRVILLCCSALSHPKSALSFSQEAPAPQGGQASKVEVRVGVSKAACPVLTSWLEPEVFSFCFQAYFLGNKMRIIRVQGEEMGRSPGTEVGLQSELGIQLHAANSC